MIPSAAIRLYDRYSSENLPFDAESVSSTYEADRYVNIVGGRYYGMNLEVLKLINISPGSNSYADYQFVRFLPVVLVLLALILALLKIRRGNVYRYIAISGLLVALAAIPYTGWILGYFISARMISRVSWFLPLGLAGSVVVVQIQDWMKVRRDRLRRDQPSIPLDADESVSPVRSHDVFASLAEAFKSRNKPIDPFIRGILTGSVFMVILQVSVILPRSPGYFEVLDRNMQLAHVGAYIDQVTESPTTVIALGYSDQQLLPSVSAHASLISFREEKEYNPHNYFLPIEEVLMRMDDSNTIRTLDPSISSEIKCGLFDDYDVRFLLAKNELVEQYLSLMDTCKEKFVVSLVTDDLILLEYR
jgi:hypothetical protein